MTQIQINKVRKQRNTDKCYVGTNLQEEAFLISMDLVLKHRIVKDISIPVSEFDLILEEQSLINAKQSAYNYAAYKPRSEKQVYDKLRSLNYLDLHINYAIEFIREFDLIDDDKFIANFIRMKVESKNFGKRRLVTELRKKGIKKEVAESNVERYYPHNSDHENALKAANKKLRSLRNKELIKQKNSMRGFLTRQGYDWEVIKTTLDALWNNDDH